MTNVLHTTFCFQINVELFRSDSSAALYFAGVATVSAIIGQHVVGKVIKALGRASLIIFILSLTIFVSALTLGMCKLYICGYIFCFFVYFLTSLQDQDMYGFLFNYILFGSEQEG